jgi:hypothetical protein
MNDMDAEIIGNRLISILGLKVKTNGRVDTAYGDKTPIGLARLIDNEIMDGNGKEGGYGV